MTTPQRKAEGIETAAAFMAVGLLMAVGLVALMLYSGLVLRYAWDVVILHTFTGAPRLGYAQAIGISTIIGYYSREISNQAATRPARDVLKDTVIFMAAFPAVIWMLHFFIAGA